MSKIRLDEDAREVLQVLVDAGERGLNGLSIQGAVKQWPVRPALNSVTRRGLVDHDGYREVAYRQYTISDKGREALS